MRLYSFSPRYARDSRSFRQLEFRVSRLRAEDKRSASLLYIGRQYDTQPRNLTTVKYDLKIKCKDFR